MARPVTLASLVAAAQRRAGLVNATSVNATALAAMVQQSATDCYDIILEAFGEDYYVSETTLNTVGGSSSVDLPTDFYRLVLLRWPSTSEDASKLQPVTWDDIDFHVRGWTTSGPPRYHLAGSSIVFSPTPSGVESVACTYVPILPEIDDTGPPPVPFQGINGWEEFIIWDVAGKLREEDESDSTRAYAERDRIEARIRRMAPRRDKHHPHRLVHRRKRRWLMRYF